MHKYGWHVGLETGIGVIDRQHCRIAEYICLLQEAHDYGYQPEYIAHMIAELVQYTHSHFLFEEALQREAGYPYCQKHKQSHDNFAERLKACQDKFSCGENVWQEMSVLLETWLFNHIRQEDYDYIDDLQAILQQDRKSYQTEGLLATVFG